MNNHKNFLATLKAWGKELGVADVGVTPPYIIDNRHLSALSTWIKHGYNGTMEFMHQHQTLRAAPRQLMPEVQSIICCRIDYPPRTTTLSNSYCVPYALTRDYHKVVHQRLTQLTKRIKAYVTKEHPKHEFKFRIFCDSAPVLEKALATQAGLGWIGKNGLLINEESGSSCFLGEVFTNLQLEFFIGNEKIETHHNKCGSCQRCIDACPTQALYAPHTVNAQRCIAYLTIEHRGAIPAALQPFIGTQIFGCDLCQQCCPWNQKKDGGKNNNKATNNVWQHTTLEELATWDEATYLRNTAGTPLRRLGYTRWQRNLAVARTNFEKHEMYFLSTSSRYQKL